MGMRGGQSYSLAGEACGPGLVCRGWSHSREKRGRIIAKGIIQEAEGSDGEANYEARKPALRMYCLHGSLLHPVQPIQVGRSCPHPDDWAVLQFHKFSVNFYCRYFRCVCLIPKISIHQTNTNTRNDPIGNCFSVPKISVHLTWPVALIPKILSTENF